MKESSSNVDLLKHDFFHIVHDKIEPTAAHFNQFISFSSGFGYGIWNACYTSPEQPNTEQFTLNFYHLPAAMRTKT